MWPVGDDFMSLRQIHMKTHTSSEVLTNLTYHIAPQESHDLNQDREKNCSKTNDMGDKLPHGISSEGAKMPLSSPSNSLSTPPMVKGGVETIATWSFTPSLKQLAREQWPPSHMVDYWGALTSPDPCWVSRKEDYLLIVTHNVLEL